MGESSHARHVMRTYLRQEKNIHTHIPDAMVDYLITLERHIHAERRKQHGKNQNLR
ncbi:hypothetical protein [Corynebacterium renale]|uniref:hypothetical protein n=1 Tax=Corynebacterium renale TaxID=1724 RepID=UPI000DF9D327|nr:hypothetical protein [Corynebacterium renale]STC97640.1 Uncharacterised protein [Corynebacterium renale]STD70285.1 Uncharacterised protein [Corynebacterium renale]